MSLSHRLTDKRHWATGYWQSVSELQVTEKCQWDSVSQRKSDGECLNQSSIVHLQFNSAVIGQVFREFDPWRHNSSAEGQDQM